MTMRNSKKNSLSVKPRRVLVGIGSPRCFTAGPKRCACYSAFSYFGGILIGAANNIRYIGRVCVVK